MTRPNTRLSTDERLLTFEIGGHAYALPISGILEVTEIDVVRCIPTLPARVGGVINHHGDALPLIRGTSLLELETADTEGRRPVLVLAGRNGVTARLGLPVDRVIGLVDAGAASGRGVELVAERRSINGRLTNILDPDRLVTRAREVVGQAIGEHAARGA